MKIQKKITLGLVGALMSLMMFVASANAYVCSSATIEEIGQQPAWSGGGAVHTVKLLCAGSASSIRYFISPDIGDSAYATVLTAFSMNKQVTAWIEAAAWNSLITDIVILPTP